jgi:hypothetical protein
MQDRPRRGRHHRGTAEGMTDKGIKRSMLPPGRIDRFHRLAQMQHPAGRRPVSGKIETDHGVAGRNQRIGQRHHVVAARSVAMHQISTRRPAPARARTRPEYMGGDMTLPGITTRTVSVSSIRPFASSSASLFVALRLGGTGPREQPRTPVRLPFQAIVRSQDRSAARVIFSTRDAIVEISRLVQL